MLLYLFDFNIMVISLYFVPFLINQIIFNLFIYIMDLRFYYFVDSFGRIDIYLMEMLGFLLMNYFFQVFITLFIDF
jgi:hypothetical protein